MRELLACVALALALARGATAAEPVIPPPQGFVTDTAHVIDAATTKRLTDLLTELQRKTGSEIAVLTVETTEPLDDFSYALKVADTWKPGRKREDTGLVFLVAVRDRKLRILTGYGLEGILPDGLVGQIQDEAIVPEFKAGRIGAGIERGVRELASRIAAERGVTLTGVPPPPPRAEPVTISTGLVLLIVIAVVLILLAAASSQGPPGMRGRRRGIFIPGGFGGGYGGGGGFGGGFGGGGGGFGGFGGGGFGGGGAGRSW